MTDNKLKVENEQGNGHYADGASILSLRSGY